ncbi:MAG: alpha/beta hydrolase [Paludibacter sp.]|nr:alpha/beta hydrolase [Paludibacter sp.]
MKITRSLVIVLFFFLLVPAINAQQVKKIVLPLEYTGTPVSNGLSGAEKVSEDGGISNISVAEMTVLLPQSEKPTSCVVMFPGGAYQFVNMIQAGFNGAEVLNKAGVAAVVVKYRLPNGNGMIPLEDGTQAIRMVRKMAKEWNIDPAKIGIYGSSAGGHLASMLSVHYQLADLSSPNEWDHYSSKPDFVILAKAVIESSAGATTKNFLGKNPSEEQVKFANSLNYITKDCAPTFIVHSTVDKAAPVQGAVKYYQKLIENGVPAEMHIFAQGGHGGIGFTGKHKPEDEWVNLLLRWKYLY